MTQREINVGQSERWASAIGGVLLALYGLKRRSLGGLALAAAGTTLAYRGLSGHCDLYAALGIDRAPGSATTRTGNLGIKIDRAITVNVPRERVYAFWRNFENLPRIMRHLERVQVNGNRSRWTVKAPVGMKVEWEAELINDIPDDTIAWRTLDNAIVSHAGSVRFEPAPGGRGTVVKVSLQYDPPAGGLGHAVASLLGDNPEQQIDEDLRNFKEAIESGRLAA